tara:strand:- start:558 stop:986 length:429 start_codon:yes stop_codon:yes gene_type:complete
MIKYKLKCEDCEKDFDSWFSSSLEFEKLKKNFFLNCHFCGSKKIVKNLMAPNILYQSLDKENKIINKKKKNVRKKILEFQNFIKNNFEYVGNEFTYKARSLHYGNKNYKKGIYGSASRKQIKELQDEGIATQTFPWIEDKNN